MRTNNLLAAFLTAFEQKCSSSEITVIPLALDDTQFGLNLKPEIIDTILQEVRTFSSLREQQLTKHVESVEALNICLEALTIFIKNNEEDVHKPTTKISTMLKKLFDVDEANKSNKPSILELWTAASTLYKRFYTSIQDEVEENMENPNASLKNKANTLMSRVVVLITTAFPKLLKKNASTEGVEKIFANSYHTTVEAILETILKAVETFSFDSNYLSTLIWRDIASLIREVSSYRIAVSLQIPLKAIKKLKALLKWSYTQEFQNFFEFMPDKTYVTKIVQVLMNLFIDILARTEYSLATKLDYFGYLSSFSEVNLMINKKSEEKKLFYVCAYNVQEQLIRCYLRVHLEAQLTIPKDSKNTELIYCTERVLTQAWELIISYSSFQRSFLPELESTHKIIGTVLKTESTTPKVLNFEVISALYSNCLFNLEVDYTLSSYEQIREILVHLYNSRPGDYEHFASQLSLLIQENSETVLREAESLDGIYYRNDPAFIKRYYNTKAKVIKFTERLILLLSIKQDRDYKDLLSDPDLQKAFRTHFAKLVVSPAFYMLGADSISIMTEICLDSETVKTLQSVALPEYVKKIANISKLLQQHVDQKDNMESMLKRKLRFLVASDFDIGSFLADSVSDDIKKTYGINSRLLNIIYLNSINVLQMPFPSDACEKVTRFATALNQELVEVVTATMILTFDVQEKTASNKKEITIISLNLIHDSTLTVWTTLPVVRDYFKRKVAVLTDMLIDKSSQEANKGSFLRKFSAFYRLQEMIAKLSLEDLLEALNTKGVIESIFELSLNVLPFSRDSDLEANKLIEQRFAFSKNEGELQYLYSHLEKALVNHFDLMSKLFELEVPQNHAKRDKLIRLQDSYLRRIRKILLKSLNGYDIKPNLLEPQTGDKFSPSKITNSLYHCCEVILNRLVDTHSRYNKRKIFNEKGKEEMMVEVQGKSTVPELSYEKKIFSLLLSKMFTFYDSSFSAPSIKPPYRGVFCEFLKDVLTQVSSQDSSEDSDPTCKKDLLKLQRLSSVIVFLHEFISTNKVSEKAEHNYYVQAIQFFVKMAGEQTSSLVLENLTKEISPLLIDNFVHAYSNMIVSLIDINKYMLVSSLGTPSLLQYFKKNFDVLCVMIKKWEEMTIVLKSAGTSRVFDRSDLSILFYFGLQDSAMLKRLSLDKQMLSILIKYLGKRFYAIAEIFALHAFDTEKIIGLKLKSLAHLDSSGERILENNTIKIFEDYWPEVLKKVWNESLVIKESKDAETKHLSKKIIPIEDQSNIFVIISL